MTISADLIDFVGIKAIVGVNIVAINVVMIKNFITVN